jgi:GntR family transcriptional repressor for pyruvate dehydrogenase complex
MLKGAKIMTKRRSHTGGLVRPVSSVTLSEQVANQIMDMITSNQWKPGEKLPSEAELCEAFRVSRTTLREALKSLAFVGYVRMRAGEGTYVREDHPSTFGRGGRNRLSHERNVWYIIETRFTVESRTVMLCAQRASDEDLRNLQRLVNELQLRHDTGSGGIVELDVEFHLAIAASCGNPFLREFMNLIREPVLHLMYALKRKGFEESQSEHLRILEALNERNPGMARRAMQAHLRHYWRSAKVFLDQESV